MNFSANIASSTFTNENIKSLKPGNYPLPNFIKFEDSNQSADSRYLTVDQDNLDYDYGYYMINFTIYVYDPKEENPNYILVYS